MTRFGTTIGEVLGFDGESFDPERVKILRMLVTDRINHLLSVKNLQELHLAADPIKLFIKQEPHKISKLIEGRLRLISAVSMVDTMIDRMLFQELFASVVSSPFRTPVAIGWTPLGSGAAYFKAHFSGKTFDTDKKHWDWTFPFWLLEDCYKVLTSCHYAPAWWHRLAHARFMALYSEAVFRFPDGSTLQQPYPGIQKSGCYLTLLLNSLGQWMLHVLAEASIGCKVKCISFGDDVTQESTEFDESFANYYRKLGFSLQTGVHDDPEFIGFHIYPQSAFLPSYRDKHVFLLSHLTRDEENAVATLRSYQYLYWFDKSFLEFLKNIALARNLPQAILLDEQIEKVVFGR
uniref:Putative RNA-dependent RNA polymerase n=1 Tax=Motts Mill virus TaxID=1654359 RepID=A0A2Z4QKS0_9VIRU|nr:putative RNA-dependent RNA polymerase [Motts Mill virus]AWY11079.1 putative RNA-dependent RNA polymerase [Motts Mill virus]AWY11199.1 putative RNA-dependent RNA polymerase [Motts Mill virus]